jgi:hypothetical protein
MVTHRKRRRGYKQYEARLIQLLRWRFQKAALKADDHLKVGKLPLEIDLIVSRKLRNKAKPSSPLPRLFKYFRRYNVLELKTEQNPLTLGDLLKLQAYAWLYMEQHEIYSVAEVSVTAVVHHLTPAVIAALPALGYKRIRKGIFKCRHSAFAAYLISLEDLPDKQVPEELKIFSNPKRRRQVFLSCIGKKEKQPIMDALTDLFESEVFKLMGFYDAKPSTVRKFVKALGKEKVVAALSKEERMAGLSKKDLIAALSKKDLIAALSEKDIIVALRGKERILKSLLADLTPEQRQKLLEQRSRNGASKRQNGKSRLN